MKKIRLFFKHTLNSMWTQFRIEKFLSDILLASIIAALWRFILYGLL